MGLKIKTKKKKENTSNKKLKIHCGKTVVVNIDAVLLDPKNARKNNEAVPKLMKKIAEKGQRTPITVWKENNIIYKGNTTWKAMKKLGYEEIAVTYQDFKDSKEAIEYSVSDNKSGEWSEWDNVVLAELIREEFSGVQSKSIAESFGFEEKEIVGLQYDTDTLPDALPDVDIEGALSDKADYMVVQFKNRKAMQDFKQLVDPDNKQPRVIAFEKLEEFYKAMQKLGNAGIVAAKAGKSLKKSLFKFKRGK